MHNSNGKSTSLPHACIISAADIDAAVKKAETMAAAAVCSGSGARPCGLCRHCRKAEAHIHPDISRITRPLDDKGRKKKQIIVEQIRALSADACLLPNEAERKVYIIEEAESMNPSAQNAALKLLEEPPLGAVFLLCTTNPSQLLPTVRSRCAEISLGGKAQDREEEKSSLPAAYLKAVSSADAAALMRWCISNEGMDNAAASEFISGTRELLTDMLCGREKNRELSREDLMRLAALMDKCGEYLRFNVGIKHIFGLLAVDSIAGSGNRG